MDIKTTMGCLAVFGSAFCFYMATVIIKWSSMAGLEIDSSLFTFARFVVGGNFNCFNRLCRSLADIGPGQDGL